MKRLLLATCLALLLLPGLVWAQEEKPSPAPEQSGSLQNEPAKKEAAPPKKPGVSPKALPKEGLTQDGRRKVPLKLLDSIRIGLTNNLDLKSTLLNRAVQRWDLSLAERLFEPEFLVRGAYGYDSSTATDTRGLGLTVDQKIITAGTLQFDWSVDNLWPRNENDDSNTANLRLTLFQPLWRNAGVTVGTSERTLARYSEESNSLGLTSSVIGKITEIQEAYWGLLLALENRISSLASLRSTEDLKRRNQELIRAGRMPPADLVQTEQQVASQKVDVLDQEFNVEEANRTLTGLLDLDDTVVIYPVEGLVYHPVVVTFNPMMALALKQNIDLQQGQVTIKTARLNLELARSASKDEINLNASVSTSSSDEPTPGAALDRSLRRVGDGWGVGLTFGIPLGLPRDRLQQQVRSAKRNLDVARLSYKNTMRSVRQGVRNRVNDVRRALRQIKLAQLSHKLAQQKYDTEVTRLELGRSTNFQVLSFQRDLNDAQRAEHRAIVTYLISLARLEAVTGTSLSTWQVEIITPELPKVPSINLTGLNTPERDKEKKEDK